MKRAMPALTFFIVFALIVVALGQVRGPAPASGGWPQTFQLARDEHASFAFVVVQPGPISVAVQSQGLPVTLTLTGPLPQPIEKSGAGVVRLDYTATASDIGRGSIWYIQLRPQGTPAVVAVPPQTIIIDQNTPRPAASQPVTAGMITVVHPAGDINKARTEQAARISARPPATQPTAQQFLDQRKKIYLQTVAAAQASQAQQVARLRQAATPAVPQIQTQGNRGPATAAGSRAGTQAGSTQATPPPAGPVISSVSPVKGQPGDSVWIVASGLDSNVNVVDVHFIVDQQGKEIVVTAFGNGYYGGFFGGVGVQLPPTSGVMPFDGQVYVSRRGDGQKSNRLNFHFDPTLDFVQLAPRCDDPNAQIANIDFGCPYAAAPYPDQVLMIHHDGRLPLVSPAGQGNADIFGHKAEDMFYANTALKNRWIVDSVAVVNQAAAPGGVSVLISGVGSPAPFVDVHWWTDAFGEVLYKVLINIKGPTGVPYF